MYQLHFRDLNKYDLFNLLYLGRVEQVGYDELRESADSLTTDSEVTEELMDFLYSTSPTRFTGQLAEEWLEYSAARELGFLTGWVYGVTLVNILQLLYKFSVAEASRQEIYEDALDLIGEASDKVVANALADYVEELNPDDFEGEQLEVWLSFKAKADAENISDDSVQELGMIEALAKAFKTIHETGRCYFNSQGFGAEWVEVADTVIDVLGGLKCDLEVEREMQGISIYVYD